MNNTLIAEIFKSNTLVGIEIHDRKEHMTLVWQPFKKAWCRWFSNDQKEGFKEWWSGSYVYTEEEIKKGKYCGISLLVENNKVYYHARVTFIFTEGRKFHKYFDTKEEAEKFAGEYRTEYIDQKGQFSISPSFRLRKDY